MDEYEKKILSLLDDVGGYTTGIVADIVGPRFGHSKRAHSAFIRGKLLDLEKRGVVTRMDEGKPVCWMLTRGYTTP